MCDFIFQQLEIYQQAKSEDGQEQASANIQRVHALRQRKLEGSQATPPGSSRMPKGTALTDTVQRIKRGTVRLFQRKDRRVHSVLAKGEGVWATDLATPPQQRRKGSRGAIGVVRSPTTEAPGSLPLSSGWMFPTPPTSPTIELSPSPGSMSPTSPTVQLALSSGWLSLTPSTSPTVKRARTASMSFTPPISPTVKRARSPAPMSLSPPTSPTVKCARSPASMYPTPPESPIVDLALESVTKATGEIDDDLFSPTPNDNFTWKAPDQFIEGSMHEKASRYSIYSHKFGGRQHVRELERGIGAFQDTLEENPLFTAMRSQAGWQAWINSSTQTRYGYLHRTLRFFVER